MMKEQFSQRDLAGFDRRQVTREEVEVQAERLTSGSQKVAAQGACTPRNGISIWNDKDVEILAFRFQENLNQDVASSQFVPASGAASRMFKALVGELDETTQTILATRWGSFPFADQMRDLWGGKFSSSNEIARAIVDEQEGLGLAKLPKGCVPFHAYSAQEVRTPFEEHAVEWARCGEGKGTLVFTIQNRFRAQIETLLAAAEVNLRLEEQHPSTDTIAWDLTRGAVLRDADGELVWRPGGHGALLKNLGEVPGDVVFVRNIDNVVDEVGMVLRNRWQRALGGAALELQAARDQVVHALRRGEEGAVAAARAFCEGLVQFQEEPKSRQAWEDAIHRPIRVAGMVPNVGQPGGGPFWIADGNGHLRPGIAESAELAEGLMEQGTHFNPVDMACVMVDADGQRMALDRFADQGAFFTADKTHGVTPIRILERPGLWNGGMAGWLTKFVEVPAETFAPVKTVFDLLERQPRRRGGRGRVDLA